MHPQTDFYEYVQDTISEIAREAMHEWQQKHPDDLQKQATLQDFLPARLAPVVASK